MKWREWLLSAITLPYGVATHVLGALTIALRLADSDSWEAGTWVLVQRPALSRVWNYSTTLGPVIWIHTRHVYSERISYHERIHVRQVQDLMLLSLIVGTIVGLWSGSWEAWILVWASGGVWQLPNFLTAAIRYGWSRAYRESSHEQHAYDTTARYF